MDQIYYGIYQTLYTQGVRLAPFPPDGPLREQIDRAEQTELAPQNFALRPDAKYLLLVNFHAMVRTPLLIGGRVDGSRVTEDTAGDLRLIMRAAAERFLKSGAPEPREISGHQVIDAVSTVWSELKTLVHKAWD